MKGPRSYGYQLGFVYPSDEDEGDVRTMLNEAVDDRFAGVDETTFTVERIELDRQFRPAHRRPRGAHVAEALGTKTKLLSDQRWSLYHASRDLLSQLLAVEFECGSCPTTSREIDAARALCVSLGHDPEKLPQVDPRSGS